MKKLVIFLLLFFLACPSYAAYRKAKAWENKPICGSTIDWSNPLSNGLVFCALMNEGGGLKVIDLTRYSYQSAVNDTPTFSNGKLILNGSDWIDYTTNKLNILGDITFVTKIFTGTGADESIISKTTTNGGSNTPFDFGVYWNSASVQYPKIGRANATGYRVWSGRTTNIYNLTSFLAISQPSTIETPPTFFVNGIYATTITNLYAGSGSGAATSNSNPATIGNRDDNGTQFSGDIHFIYLYNRILSPSEIQSLYVSPYQFIIAPKRRIISPTTNITPGNTKNRTFIID